MAGPLRWSAGPSQCPSCEKGTCAVAWPQNFKRRRVESALPARPGPRGRSVYLTHRYIWRGTGTVACIVLHTDRLCRTALHGTLPSTHLTNFARCHRLLRSQCSQPPPRGLPCLGGVVRRGGVTPPNGNGRRRRGGPPSSSANTSVRSTSLEKRGSPGHLPGRVRATQ